MPGPLAVMMPVYDEARTLPTILERVLRRPEVGQLIAVDDGSSDDSWKILREAARRDPRVRPLRQLANAGKGAALRRAIEALREPYAIVQDADLELDPDDYPLLVEPILSGRAEVVYGVRDLRAQFARQPALVMGNWGVTLACNLLFDAWLHDVETGYKLMPSAVWKSLGLVGNRFEIEPEITARLLRLGHRIHEVPIRYAPRTRAEGKKIGWQDGRGAIAALLKVRFGSRARLFPEAATDR